MLIEITPNTQVIDTPEADTPLRVIRINDQFLAGPPYALLYRDNSAPLWRLWSRHNTTESAAWEAHSTFGAPRPGEPSKE